MTMNRRTYLKASASLALTGIAAGTGPASAQSRAQTLRHVMGAVFSSLDPTLSGATRESFPLSVNVYDRLASFERKQVAGGYTFDFENIRGELAERIDRSSDGLSFTFHLRQGATWHDGSPVEAADVKWSLDRAITAPTLSKAQMANGSMTSTDQIKVVGDRQVEIRLARPDRLALSTLCVPFLPMFNSKLARRHASADDPWAIAWLKENTAGGGAYSIESNRPGQQVVLRRNDKWKNGPLPFFQRIIIQTIPDISARASLVERGDADLTLDAAASDIPGIEQRGRARVVPIPQSNAFQCVAFNTTTAPFNDVRLRRAIALALPYDDMFKAALFGRGLPLYGATWDEPPSSSIFQPMPNRLDLDRAKALLAEAGLSGGLKTTFTFPVSASATVEPMAALVQESLARLNIEVTIQKLPDAQFTTMVVERRLPMFYDFGTSWLLPAEYIARVFFSGTSRWNASGLANREIADLAEQIRFETDKTVYETQARRIVKLIKEEVPVAMLWHPSHDAVIAKNIEGYTYWFHRGADYRDLKRV